MHPRAQHRLLLSLFIILFIQVCDKYQREVSILSRMQQSPHVVDLYGVYEDEDSLYILMELLEGGELSAMLARPERPCKEEMALILRQVLSFLAHAHANGICYGDVKPGNFLFRKRHNAHEFQDLLSKPCEGLRCYGPEIKVGDLMLCSCLYIVEISRALSGHLPLPDRRKLYFQHVITSSERKQ